MLHSKAELRYGALSMKMRCMQFVLFLVATTLFSCRPSELDSLLLDDTDPDIPVAVFASSDNQIQLFFSSKGIEHEQSSYCIGTKETCTSESAVWQDAEAVSAGSSTFAVNEPLVATDAPQVHFRFTNASEILVQRSIQISPQTQQEDPEPQPEETQCIDAEKFICDVELAIHKYTNQYREQNNRRPVEFQPKIAYVSRDWSKKQFQRGSIGHEGFVGSRIQVYRQRFQTYDGRMASENVAMSGGMAVSRGADYIGQYFARMWYNSDGHRRNMLSSGVRTHGAGVYISGRRAYATQIFGR